MGISNQRVWIEYISTELDFELKFEQDFEFDLFF